MTKPKRKTRKAAKTATPEKTRKAKPETRKVHAQVSLPVEGLPALRKVSGVEFLYATRRKDGGATAFLVTAAAQVNALRASGFEASVIAPINTVQDMKREVSQTNRFLARLRPPRARRKP